MKNKKNVSALYKIMEFLGLYIMMYLLFAVLFAVGLKLLINGLGIIDTVEIYGGFSQILNEYVVWYNLFIPLGLTIFAMNVCFGKESPNKVSKEVLTELKEVMPKLWVVIVLVGMALLDLSASLGFSLITLLISGYLSRLVIIHRLNRY